MKIMLTGGGTGGHFYPIIAIAEKLIEGAEENKIIDLKLYYMSNSPYDKRMLFENKIKFVPVPAGKIGDTSTFKKIFDIFPIIAGLFWGLINMFFIFPDVVISKGGYAAFPAVFAAKLLKIPVIIHESDSFPGKLNVWTSKFAKYIAISWPEAVEHLPKDKTALTGQPIRKNILHGDSNGAKEFFNLEKDLPTILVIGGSQGAQKINDIIIDVLPDLLERYQIIHQTGIKNIEASKLRANLLLEKTDKIKRYKAVDYLNDLDTRMAAGAASLVISRAGSAISEIASWGLPSIIIPITNSNGDHQRKNAYSYARSGSCEVIEESNLTKHLLISEIDKIMNDKLKRNAMSKNALSFANHEAAKKIATKAIEVCLEHEQS